MIKKSTFERNITESRDGWKPVWSAGGNGFVRCRVNG